MPNPDCRDLGKIGLALGVAPAAKQAACHDHSLVYPSSIITAIMGRKYNFNARTIATPIAAFCMASLLFVYARTSIMAAKRNAQMHREADGGQISWRNESLRRHGAMATPDESKSTVKQLLEKKGAKEEAEVQKVTRSEEEDLVRQAARSSRGRKEHIFLNSNSRSGADGTHSPPPSLLTLPSEVRCMIWEAVALCSGPILVCADSFTHGPLAQVARFRYTIPAPAPPPTYKRRRFPNPGGKRATKQAIERDIRGAALKTANPLTWLLANRQIYTEARPIFYANVCLGFNDPVCLASFMFETADIFIKPSMVKSISLDLRLAIDANPRDKTFPPFSDKCDEFSFSRAVKYGWERPVELQQHPKSANVLVCKDNREQIAGFSKWLCAQVPLRVFSKVRLHAVDVQFSLEEIESNPSFHGRGYLGLDYRGCWCDNSMVDKESIESCGIAEEIKRLLMNGDSEEED
ncbi:hypothetical protein V492_06547 [Pseudogymnoascus sp. VKM F-4246]|nr:hypothetical protein V492_06547 [Pseudogymnoascus sp. VKM F-4246]